ncbi:MAG: polysaccharide biosynthesis tyrosine autokinase, partial [Lysobacteraceae bacterium]
ATTGSQYLTIRSESPWSGLKRLLQGSKTKAASNSESSTKANVEKMTRAVLGGLVIEPLKDSRLVKISFDSPSASFATVAANTVANSFISSNIEHSFDASAYAKKYLEDGLAQLKAKLEDSERQLVGVAQKEKIFSSNDNQTLSDQSLTQLNAALSSAQAARIAAEARWRQAASASGTSLPSDMLGNSIIKTLQAKRADLMGQYQDKLNTYKPAYPLMVQLKSQIDEIEKQIRSETGNVKGSARADYSAALAQESLLKQQIDSAKGDVLDLAGRSIQYNVLKREVDTNRQLYDGLLQRYKEVGLAGGVATNNISVVDPAEVPGSPYKPNLPRNLALALLGGLLLGGMLALGFEFLDDTLKTPADIEKHLGLAVLGLIPKLKNMTPAKALEDPRSAFAESYRSVRTALQFSTESGVPRSLLVTSARPAEGKSTSALTLANNFAQLGKRVLLIDADLRNPSLHKTLGLDNSLGLSNCLAGAAKPQDVIHAPDDTTLHVLLSGPIPPNPAELLSGPKMLSLLTVAMAKYDQVIIDGPPTIGLADAPIIAHVAMGTLLVIDAGETRKPIAKGAVKRLQVARARLVGALLTKVDANTGAYGYGYGDYNYYAYGGDTPKLTRK